MSSKQDTGTLKHECRRCRWVKSSLRPEAQWNDRETSIELSGIRDGRLSDCPFIRLVDFDVSELQRIQAFKPAVGACGQKRRKTPWRIYFDDGHNDDQGPFTGIGIGLVDAARGPIRPIPADQIDIARVKQWISTCESDHHGRCSEDRNTLWQDTAVDSLFPGLQTFRLIDVCEGRIEEFNHNVPSRYVVLSYVWGGVSRFPLSKANICSLLTQEGFSLVLESIPRTVTDAMDLVRQLGERYLWVDALCLIQDDAVDVQLGVAVMDRIYERATFTVAAAGGTNAGSGLDAFRPGSPSSQRRQYIQEVNGMNLAVFQSLPGLVRPTVWAARGWTLQEQILSRRMLYFVDHKVFSTVPPGFFPSGDAMRAMAGIIRSFSEIPELQDGFLEGLPRSSLDYSLLFTCTARSLRRRPGFPSYSWTGWIGPLEYVIPYIPNKAAHLSGWLRQYTWITWFSRDPSSSEAPGLVWDPSRPDKSLFSLPRYEGYPQTRQRPFKDESQLVFPTEETMINPTVEVSARKGLQYQYPLLQFWTFSVFYRLRLRNASKGLVDIIDKADRRIGCLYMDGFHDLNFFHTSPRGKIVEVILLSRYQVYDLDYMLFDVDGSYAWAAETRDVWNATMEYGYHVMCLEWTEGGVAERRGIGIITSFEAISRSYDPGPVWKEIILG